MSILKKSKAIAPLILILAVTWAIGAVGFHYSGASYLLTYNFNKETSTNLYPESVVGVSGYEKHHDGWLSLNADPQFFITPPEQIIASTLIEFDAPVPPGFSVKLYYAREGEVFSETNSIHTEIPEGGLSVGVPVFAAPVNGSG